MTKQLKILCCILILHFSNSHAQKVCRQNYKNEISIAYNELFSFVLGAMSASYERTIYHKKGKDRFVSAQLEYTNKIDLSGLDRSNVIAIRFITPSLKYNFGDKHIYSLGAGVVFSGLNIILENIDIQ
jgi:hypothetical protein